MNHLASLMKIAKASKAFTVFNKYAIIVLAAMLILGMVVGVFLYMQPAPVEKALENPAFKEAIADFYENASEDGVELPAVFDDARVLIGNLISSFALTLVALFIGYFLNNKFARYFDGVLADGTPFTYEGAAALKKLGWHLVFYSLILGVATGIAESILFAIFPFISTSNVSTEVGGVSMIIYGLFCFLLAKIFNYGAYLEKKTI